MPALLTIRSSGGHPAKSDQILLGIRCPGLDRGSQGLLLRDSSLRALRLTSATTHGQLVFYDTGHFALETHAVEIGQEILAFLKGHL